MNREIEAKIREEQALAENAKSEGNMASYSQHRNAVEVLYDIKKRMKL